jgi:hypothetical protein
MFKYINSLEGGFKSERYVLVVTFDISRYGRYQNFIEFDYPRTEKEAIKAVEQHLSTLLDERYFNKIKDDLFITEWSEAKEHYICIGDCLSDCKYLEMISRKDGGRIYLSCGS